MNTIVIPKGYVPALDVYDTQKAISFIKRTFQDRLAAALNLKRVSAPLFVTVDSGLNDNLNGYERPVSFDIPAVGTDGQVVQSLAKWKRLALKNYRFFVGNGLYTDMNAIRRDEELDNLHSIYVDQWDWEKVIRREDRTLDYLKDTASRIVNVICDTSELLCVDFPSIRTRLSRDMVCITSQELEDRYPDLTPKEREYKAAKEYGAVFLMQVGGALRSGKIHDGRAPDYDDWSLNGDILLYDPLLDISLEVSSMGIRVDPETLMKQLKIRGCEERAELPFQKALLNGELPQTIGGGIGQSRMCVYFLRKAHVGEVQASLWPEEVQEACRLGNIPLL